MKRKTTSEKNQKEEEETAVVEEKSKTLRKRVKSVMADIEEPLLVPLVIPPGTDEIQKLKESSPDPPVTTRTKRRSHSYNRLNEKEVEKEVKQIRRKSISISSPIKRSMSSNQENLSAQKKLTQPVATSTKEQEKPLEESFNPHLVIKDEPMSGDEEQTEDNEQSAFTLSDLPELMQDKSGKRKVIMISTNEENGENLTMLNSRGRAKKSFPNPVNQRQLDQLGNGRNGNWMVCIPQAQVAQAQV